MPLNPQQLAFKEAYCNPQSPTFGNKLQSALKAGYTQEYAESIGNKDTLWMAEIIGDMQMLSKAEKVLDKTLDLVAVTPEGKADVSLLRVQNDTAKFVAETLGKEKYSKRSELTGKGGEKLGGNSLDGLSEEAKAKMRAIYEEDMKKKLTKSE